MLCSPNPLEAYANVQLQLSFSHECYLKQILKDILLIKESVTTNEQIETLGDMQIIHDKYNHN